MFEPPASDQPEQGQRGGAAGGIYQDIGKMAGAGGDKQLVDFIAGGVEKYAGQGEPGMVPAPRARRARAEPADGPPEEQGEDGVFGEVTAFAEDVMKGFDVRLRHVREEPVQEWFDQSRRVRV